MPDACFTTVAKELNAFLAAPSPAFSQTFAPERSYADWDLKLEDNNLHVDTVLVATEIKTVKNARGAIKYGFPIDVGIRKHVTVQNAADGRIDLAAIDALVFLTQEILERLTPESDGAELLPDSDVFAKWQETKLIVAPSKKHLRELRQFISVIRVTFEVTKKGSGS